MRRVTCALQLAALAVLVIFLLEPTGRTATAFSFVGIPLLGLSFLLSTRTLFSGLFRRRAPQPEGRSR